MFGPCESRYSTLVPFFFPRLHLGKKSSTRLNIRSTGDEKAIPSPSPNFQFPQRNSVQTPIKSCSFSHSPKASTPPALSLVSSDSSDDHIEVIAVDFKRP